MKISLHWLRQLIDIPAHLTAEIIGEKITLHTAELEEILDTKSLSDLVVAGAFVEKKPHPQSDKLTVGFFDCGETSLRQIIFGAVHPLTVGQVYPLALPGLVLPNGKVITETEIMGIASNGMVIDNQEMGMKHYGILSFSKMDIGKKLSQLIPASADQLFDIDNKSLTHRPDLMGHLGFARELSAIFDLPFAVPTYENPLFQSEKKTKVVIQTPHCRRFMAVHVGGVTVKKSAPPVLFQLEHLDTKAISNLVDITNLVMFLHGQPMHVFDADKVQGDIIVRQAKSGESLVALDGVEYVLTPEDIVIADEEKVLSIAGIMGGLASGVTNDTTRVIFESANFDPSVIRKTSTRLGLRSESSMRFEKSLDPNNCLPALQEALRQVLLTCPEAEIISNIMDNYPQIPAPKIISLDPNRVRGLSGIEFSDEQIERHLTKLGFGVDHASAAEKWLVTVPSLRATKDIAIAEDLVEEVVRLHGYENIDSCLPSLPIVSPKINLLRQTEWQIRDIMMTLGYHEVMHSSFVSSGDLAWLEADENQYVTMTNAPTLETTYLRQSLVSNLVRDLETELRTHQNIALFEIGKIYQKKSENVFYEQKNLAFIQAQFGKKTEGLFFDLKKSLSQLLWQISGGALTVTYENTDQAGAVFHPHQTAEIKISGVSVGFVGVIHPAKNQVKKSVIVLAEISLETVLELLKNRATKVYQVSSAFPSIRRDLSVIVPEKLPVGTLIATCHAQGGFLQTMELFDEFRDSEKIGANQKNLAFHLQFQSDTETLTSEQVETEFLKLVAALEDQHGAKLRVDFATPYA